MTWLTATACSDWDGLVLGKIIGSEEDARQGLLDSVNEILDEKRADNPDDNDDHIFDHFPRDISEIEGDKDWLRTEIGFPWEATIRFFAFSVDNLKNSDESWMMASYENENDDISLTVFDGDIKAAKKHLAAMVRDMKREDPEHFEYGTTAMKDIGNCNGILEAYAVFTDYHYDITAARLCDIQ